MTTTLQRHLALRLTYLLLGMYGYFNRCWCIPRLIMCGQFVCVAWLLLAVVAGNVALAANSLTEVRFFKINKKQQQTEISGIRKRREAGCHSLRVKRKVYRVQVIGYERCELYATTECDAASVLAFRWNGKIKRKKLGKEQLSTTLLRGSTWISPQDNMQRFKSWRCQ